MDSGAGAGVVGEVAIRTNLTAEDEEVHEDFQIFVDLFLFCLIFHQCTCVRNFF